VEEKDRETREHMGLRNKESKKITKKEIHLRQIDLKQQIWDCNGFNRDKTNMGI